MAKKNTVSSGSMAIVMLSTVVEWYDFTLFLYLATVLSRVFFGPDKNSLSVALASFSIAYLMRPLGAVLFGHIGDRYGRRQTMLLSMALMTAATLATALLPTTAQVGPAAGWALLALRCIMSFSVGGEYNAVVAYLVEGAQPNRRGLATSLASAASGMGGLLAVGVSSITVSLLTPLELETWGWRIPFVVGAAVAATVLVSRFRMEESPDFALQQKQKTVPKNPLRQTLTHHGAAIARGFAISALGSITYYVGIAYIPTFLVVAGIMDEGGALRISTLAAGVVIAVTPGVGLLSDWLGRKPILLALCGGAVALPISLFALMAHGTYGDVLWGVMALAALGGGVSAVGAVTTAEQFISKGRLSGLALGSSSATAIFGGLAPYVSQRLLETTGRPWAPGALIAVVAAAVMPVLCTLSETRPKKVAGGATH